MDSRATNHTVSSNKHLHNERVVGNVGKVQLPTGDSTTTSNVGNFQLNEGEVISNVLCVPAFKFNLLSVYKMTK